MPEGSEKLTKTVTKVFVDLETGEQKRFQTEEPIKKRPPGKQRSADAFGMWFPAGLLELAQLGLTSQEWNILMLLAAWSDFEEHTGYSPTDIANKLGVLRQSVSRSVRRLKEVGVLLDGGGPRRVWINPEYFWRGSLRARIGVLHRLQPQLQELKKSKAAAPQEEST